MLASVTGTLFNDLAADGFTPDDTTLGGVTVELYRDVDGNRQLSETVDLFISDTTSDPGDGTYSFDVVDDGNYLIRQIVPTGMHQTAGPPSYAFDIIDGHFFSAETQIIDGFSAPGAAYRHTIANDGPANPFVRVDNSATILGGSREVLAEVLGDPGSVSAIIQVGGGVFDFGTLLSPGTRTQLQYGQAGTTTLSIDDTHTGLRIDFDSPVDAGVGTAVSLQIRAVGSGGIATRDDVIPHGAMNYFVPFSDFTTSGSFSFAEFEQIQFEFNHEGIVGVDFIIDAISAVEEDPTGFDFGNYTTDISGTKYNDVLGDGFTADDIPLAGVTIELFADTNASGTFEDGVDQPAATPAVTDAQGKYTFGAGAGNPEEGLADGLYFIREQVPLGYIQTAGPEFYTVQIVDGRVYADGETVVDGFDAPIPMSEHVIASTDPNPLTLLHNDGSILGGRREVLAEVLGDPGFTSASIQVGGGIFDFGTVDSPGTRTQLQYGQAGITDLTIDNTHNGLRIDFDNPVDAGAGTAVSLQIRAVGPTGAATFDGAIPDSATNYFVPFSNFTESGGFSFTDLEQIQFEFNHDGVVDVDFIIDAISAVTLKPSGYDFGNFALEPAIDIEKATNGDDADDPTGPIVPVGSTVTWTYEVTNPGNMSLSGVQVTDNNGTPSDPGDDFQPTFVGGDTNTNGLLDPDETWHYEATLIATAGQHASVASVVGTPIISAGEVTEEFDDVTDEDPTHHFGADAAVDIEKATNGDDADDPTGPIVPVGSTVTWTYEVTNPGNLPLEIVIAADDNGTPGDPNDNFLLVLDDGDTNGNNLLDPGEIWTYETTRIAAAGQSESNAYVIGAPVGTDGEPIDGIDDVTDDDPTHHFGADAAIDIEKATNGDDADNPTGPIVPVGSTVTWTYEVTNPGNMSLANVTVTDDSGLAVGALLSGDTNTNGLLDPGETWQYENTLAAVIGQQASLASVVGTPVGPDNEPVEGISDVTDDDPTHHFGANAVIDIEKATNGDDADMPTGPIVPVGSMLTWTYEVTNPGNMALANVTVTDDSGLAVGALLSGDTNTNGLLDPGETWQYENTLAAVIGQQASLATVVGTPVDGSGESVEGIADVSDEDPTHHFGANAVIDIEKATNGEDADTLTGPIVPVGSTVTWTYEVTNPGNMSLDNVTVTDFSGLAVGALLSGDTNTNGLLDPGETWLYETTLPAVAGQQASLASVVGTPVDGNAEPIEGIADVTDQDPTHHFGANAVIDIEKATNGDDADTPTGPIVPVGNTVTWTYEVTNPGNMALADVTVIDDSGLAVGALVGGDTNTNGLLDPGETWQYETTLAAVIGQQASLASVVGTPVDGEGETVEGIADVTDQDPTHHFGVEATILIEKSTNGVKGWSDPANGDVHVLANVLADSIVTWTYDVTNGGNVPLKNVVVVDDNGTPSDPADDFSPKLIGGDTNGDGRLDLDETWHYSASGKAVIGTYTNIVVVTGTPIWTDGSLINGLDDVTDDAASGYSAADPETSSLSGYVYLDRNDDGIRSPDELPIPGTIITLDGLDLLKNPIHRTTMTDANGFYSFDNLPGGKCTLRETQPSAYLDGKDTAGTPTGVVTNDLISDIELPIGFAGENQNFGELGLRPEVVSKRLMVYPIGNLEDFDGRGILPPEYSTAIEGTAGDDVFEFTAGMEPGSLHLLLNGTEVPIESHIGAIHLDGLGGNDTVMLSATDGEETLSLGPDFAILVSRYFAVSAVHIESVSADAKGGEDRVTLYDSPGNDMLKAWPGYATMEGDGYSHTVTGFPSLFCATSGAGFDQALLYDSPGNDLFGATPTGATLSGDGFELKTMYFDNVHAYATAGGFDLAKLFDSPGDDEYVGKPDYAALFGDGFYNRAKFFESAHGYATAGGFDQARMYDSPGDDLFVADPIQGALFGDGYYNRAKFFEGVHAFGTAGGYDTARLYDSAGDDHFVLRPQDGALFGSDFYNRAKFFEAIEANANAGGEDDASYEPVSDSHLEAADDWARLTWGGRFAWLTEFERVNAESSGDGNDTKHIEAVDFLLLTDGPWMDI